MAEIGIQPHIVEAVVNHISRHKAGVAGHIQKALYSQEKRAAMQRWGSNQSSASSQVSLPVVLLDFGRRTDKPFWSALDDDDVVPIPGQPCRVGDARGDNKLEGRGRGLVVP